ncbi:MAG: glycosyltransferase family 2 protein [Actinobacteria bacterium]|nr:glycosyltransferase family 2 protein [Actinomycetota bacterium]
MGEPRPTDLAVVVVNFNAGEYLARCVGSVLATAGGIALDVVVVDNASGDGSHRAAAAAHPGIRLIENPENRGLSAAWNQGIRATSAPFVLVLNPDAEIWAGTLEGLVKLAGDRPRAGAIGPLIRNSDGTLYRTGRKVPSIPEALGHVLLGPLLPNNRFSRAYTLADWDRGTEREVDWVSGSCMLLRRKALDEIGLFDERFFLYAEEVDLFKRLRDGGWTVLFTPELEVLHEGGVSTGRSRRMQIQHSRSAYLYFEKHHARGWRKIFLPFAWLALRLRAEVVSLKQRSGR